MKTIKVLYRSKDGIKQKITQAEELLPGLFLTKALEGSGFVVTHRSGYKVAGPGYKKVIKKHISKLSSCDWTKSIKQLRVDLSNGTSGLIDKDYIMNFNKLIKTRERRGDR